MPDQPLHWSSLCAGPIPGLCYASNPGIGPSSGPASAAAPALILALAQALAWVLALTNLKQLPNMAHAMASPGIHRNDRSPGIQGNFQIYACLNDNTMLGTQGLTGIRTRPDSFITTSSFRAGDQPSCPN